MAATATTLLGLRLKPKPSFVVSVRHPVYFSSPTVRSNSQPSLLLLPRLRSEATPRRWRFSVQEVSVYEVNEKADDGGGSEELEEEKRRKLYVANVPWNLSAPELAKLFGECGTVKDVEMIKQKTGQSKGFAFITMASGDEARAALDKFDSYELNGRIIRVEISKSFRKPPPLPPPGSIAVDQRCKIYVSNLAWKARAVHLREFFSGKFNPISARVIFENPTGRSSGYGFVAFATKEEAQAAIYELDGKELLERPVRLRISQHSDALSDSEPEEAKNSGEEADES